MLTFHRALRWFFGLVGFAVGIIAAAAAYATRLMVAPARQQLAGTPGARGMAYEDVQFPAQDGLRVSGWFIPAEASVHNGATIILVHGWRWNRAGFDDKTLLSNMTGSQSIDLLEVIADLHADGYHILTFDMRNHGQSATARPVTFGQSEAKDLLGALAYLETRDDVDMARVATIGFSIGANAILFALPQTNRVRAAVLVQPMTPTLFSKRVAKDLFSTLGVIIHAVSSGLYSLISGMRLSGFVPAFAAAGSADVPILFIQGTGDEWGSMQDVSTMADMAPRSHQLLFVHSNHRFGGYSYVIEHPAVASRFFQQHLGLT